MEPLTKALEKQKRFHKIGTVNISLRNSYLKATFDTSPLLCGAIVLRTAIWMPGRKKKGHVLTERRICPFCNWPVAIRRYACHWTRAKLFKVQKNAQDSTQAENRYCNVLTVPAEYSVTVPRLSLSLFFPSLSLSSLSLVLSVYFLSHLWTPGWRTHTARTWR